MLYRKGRYVRPGYFGSNEQQSIESNLHFRVHPGRADNYRVGCSGFDMIGLFKQLFGGARTPQGKLFAAAKSGDVNGIRQAIAAGAEVNGRDPSDDNKTAAHHAASNNRADCLGVLAELGAKLDAKDYEGVTPLMSAAEEGKVEAVTTLVELGADIDALMKETGSTALECAATMGQHNIVEQLLQSGARLYVSKGTLSSHPVSSAVCGGDIRCLKLILDAGGNPNEVDPPGDRPLILAVSFKQMNMVELLLEAGADSNQTDEDGYTAVMLAVRVKSLAMLRRLLQAGANPNLRTNDGTSPLDIAIQQGDKQLMKELEKAANSSR
jgi:ankyrin repeat protein